MRPATAISADGPLNLLNAVRTAISPDAKGKGTLIVLNDEINAARDTTKTNTLRVETFKAPELGILGYIDEDKVSFYRTTTKRHTVNSEFDVTNLTTLPKVTILYSYIDPDASMIQARSRAASRELCSPAPGTAAFGDGRNGPEGSLEHARSITAGVGAIKPRRQRPRIATAEYDALGVIPSDTLNPQKARVLLMLSLTKTSDPKELRRVFSDTEIGPRRIIWWSVWTIVAMQPTALRR